MDKKKKIKVKFVDFQSTFLEEDNFFIDSLKKNFDVELSEDPDYIFFGAYGYKHLDYDCVRIIVRRTRWLLHLMSNSTKH
jgi:hypothetical protein